MMANIKINKYISYIVIAIATALFSILSFTGVLGFGDQLMLEKIGIAIILAVSLNVVVGFLGELSLGHAGFMCVGAYIGGKVAVLIDPKADSLIVLIFTIVIGGLVAAIFGFIIGLPALRLKGDYLAIVTLAFGEIVRSVFRNTSVESFGGQSGLLTPRYSSKYMFICCFVFVLICVAVVQNVMSSKHGRAITAIRDNEIAARATGINVTKYKLTGFILSAFFAGVAGVLFSHANNTLRSEIFDYNYSIEILVMVVLGGMTVSGSIISATLITVLNEKLAVILTGDLAVLKDMLYALILVILVIYNNAPALKGFREKYNLRALINKFRKHDPERDVNDSGRWDVVPTKIEMNEVLSTDIVVKESQSEKGDRGAK